MSRYLGSPVTGIVVSFVGALLGAWWLLTGQASPWWLLVSYLGFLLWDLVGVDGCYHRIVAHRSLQPRGSWAYGLLLALAIPGAQGSAATWATAHRVHHRLADLPGDPHRPHDGRLHAFLGWMFRHYGETVRSGLRHPLLQAQHRIYPWALLTAWVGVGLLSPLWLVYGLLMPAAHGYVAAGLVNTFGHRRAGGTRNLPLLLPLTGGGALHQNHHAVPGRAPYGFPDPIYWVLRLFARERHDG